MRTRKELEENCNHFEEFGFLCSTCDRILKKQDASCVGEEP